METVLLSRLLNLQFDGDIFTSECLCVCAYACVSMFVLCVGDTYTHMHTSRLRSKASNDMTLIRVKIRRCFSMYLVVYSCSNAFVITSLCDSSE